MEGSNVALVQFIAVPLIFAAILAAFNVWRRQFVASDLYRSDPTKNFWLAVEKQTGRTNQLVAEVSETRLEVENLSAAVRRAYPPK